MEIEIRALNVELTSCHRALIEGRLRRALKTHSGQTSAISLWLSETGSFDTPHMRRCRLQVTLIDSTVVVIDVAEAALDAAIQRAVGRAAWKLAHCISRRQVRSQARSGRPGHASASGMRILHLQASC